MAFLRWINRNRKTYLLLATFVLLMMVSVKINLVKKVNMDLMYLFHSRSNSAIPVTGRQTHSDTSARKVASGQQYAYHTDTSFSVERRPISNVDPCRKLEKPNLSEISKSVFHRVTPDSKETFVFSAHFDDRTDGEPLIRIIGLTKRWHSDNFCQVWYDDEDFVEIFPAVTSIVPETHGRRYAASIYTCRLKKPQSPYGVSLVKRKCDRPTHTLQVLPSNRTETPQNFTVCVAPLHFGFDNSKQLVEMVELNRILGADKLVFYNYSTGQSVTKFLKYYESLGVIDYFRWRLPVLVDTWPHKHDVVPDIHYFGQLVALNDCLYRYMYTSNYIIFTDLDEFIVPRHTTSWPAMLPKLNCPSNTGVFVFLCTFYRTDWGDDNITRTNATIKRYQLNTLLKLSREVKIFPPLLRSKILVKPRDVIQVGIHQVWRMNDKVHKALCNVDPRDALLHHYRRWEGGDPSSTHDSRMLAYLEQLITEVEKTHQRVTAGTHILT